MLGLPAPVLDVLDATATAPAGEPIEQTGVLGALWEAMRSGHHVDPEAPRAQRVLSAAGWVLGVVFFAGVLAYAVVILGSDDGTWLHWVMLVGAASSVLTLAPGAFVRVRACLR